jgi:hypothetical protein
MSDSILIIMSNCDCQATITRKYIISDELTINDEVTFVEVTLLYHQNEHLGQPIIELTHATAYG